MTRRALPSDPLTLLRATADVAPPEAVAARLALRLASVVSASAGPAIAVGPSAPAAIPGPDWRVLAGRFLRWSAAPLGVGIAIGASGQALLTGAARPAQSARSAASVAWVAPAPAVAPVGVAPPVPVEVSAEAAVVVTKPTMSVGSTESSPPRNTLVEERGLLDRARRELASDEPARALTFLEQHAQRFGRGQLSEEREAMWVNVLVLLDRKEEAKARGEAFQARFPNSLMGASVRAALRAADASK